MWRPLLLNPPKSPKHQKPFQIHPNALKTTPKTAPGAFLGMVWKGLGNVWVGLFLICFFWGGRGARGFQYPHPSVGLVSVAREANLYGGLRPLLALGDIQDGGRVKLTIGVHGLQLQAHLTGYLKATWPDFGGCVFEVWPAPGSPAKPSKMWGAKPPTFLNAGPARPSKRTQKIKPDCVQVPRPQVCPSSQSKRRDRTKMCRSESAPMA